MFTLMFRVLTFRLTPEEFDELGFRHFLLGTVTAWAVGFGRWWNRPEDAMPLLRSGIVSVIIVLALGLLLHVVTSVLKPQHRGLLKTTAYVSLTSLPAAVYALPLESWMELEQARSGNFAMLTVVAVWRVALYVCFLMRIARFKLYTTIVTTVFPLAVVVFLLAVNGLTFHVLQLNTGRADTPISTAESRYEVILYMGILSIYVAPVAFVLWLLLWAWSRKRTINKESEPLS